MRAGGDRTNRVFLLPYQWRGLATSDRVPGYRGCTANHGLCLLADPSAARHELRGQGEKIARSVGDFIGWWPAAYDPSK